MDRNAITGILLIGLIILGYYWFFAPEPAKDEPQTRTEQTSERETPAANDTLQAQDTTLSPVPQVFAAVAQGENRTLKLENEELEIGFSTKGGQPSYARLKEYKAYDGAPLMLFTEESADFTYILPTGTEVVKTADLYFRPQQIAANDTAGPGVRFVADMGGGRSIELSYILPKEGYMISHSMVLRGMKNVIPLRNNMIEVDWKAKILEHEKDREISTSNSTVYFREVNESPDYLDETADDEDKFRAPTQWVSFKEEFFAQTYISEEPFEHVNISTKLLDDSNYIEQMSAHLTLPFSHKGDQVYNAQFYYGPLHYRTLNRHDLELERQIPLGWSFFLIQWINRGIVIPTFNFLSSIIGSFALIILLLTILIKLIVTPFTYRSYLSQAKMRLLKPELDKLKEKHGSEDMAKLQAEQMKLYRSTGVSPFGGCLPQLLQLPFLIAMFRFFPSSIELRQEGFLWVKDLSTYDNILPVFGIERLPFEIPFYGDHVSLLTLLMAASTVLYTKISSTSTPQQAELKYLPYIMPVFLLAFFNNYAAGLSLYYLFFNLISFAQTWIFRQTVDDRKLEAKIAANRANPNKKKSGGLQARLEAMAKEQERLRQQQAQRTAPGGMPGVNNRQARRKKK